ncbi:MAG: phosphoheptose isomerase [Congregibacter sp.]
MNNYERIAREFHQRIDCIAGAVDDLAPGIEAASAAVVACVLADHKILVVGAAAAAALAEHLATSLCVAVGNKPALPAIAVTSDAEAIADHSFWHRLRTLSRDGDLLVCLDTREDALMARHCAEFARQRNLAAIVLSEKHTDLSQDLSLTINTPNPVLRSELLLMAAHCLTSCSHQLMLGE